MEYRNIRIFRITEYEIYMEYLNIRIFNNTEYSEDGI